MSTNEPLNPELYEALQEVFDPVVIVHDGLEARVSYDFDYSFRGGRARSSTTAARRIGTTVSTIGGMRMVERRSRLRTVSRNSRRRIVATMAVRITSPPRPHRGEPP